MRSQFFDVVILCVICKEFEEYIYIVDIMNIGNS